MMKKKNDVHSAMPLGSFLKRGAAGCVGLVVSLSLGLSPQSTSAAAATGETNDPAPETVSTHRLAGFRVRSDFNLPLNAEEGWTGEEGNDAMIHADRPFRVRFEIERPTGVAGESAVFGLQYRRNSGEWTDLEAHDFPKPAKGTGKSPRLSVVSCSAYRGQPTIDLLSGSNLPFQAGIGMSLTERTPKGYGPVEGAHGEFEWALVARRYGDGPVVNEEGDRFELRLIDASGTPIQSKRNPLLRLAIPPGHVGGTFVENPGRIGPFQASNGDLYFIMEPAETYNAFMMIKSTDQGRTWHEVDGGNRPKTNDLESVDARLIGNMIHILHQKSGCKYHTLRTSDHPTQPDTWAIRDEIVVNRDRGDILDQMASLVVRGDGSMVAFFMGRTIQYGIRSAAGHWGPATNIEPDTDPAFTGPQAILGAGDIVHLAYYGMDGSIRYRTVLPDGTLTPGVMLATDAGIGTPIIEFEFGAVLPLVYLPTSNTVVILYRLASGRLWERRIVNGGAPTPAVMVSDRAVVRHAVDSMQPGADVVAWSDTLHLLFIDECSRSIYYTNDKGGWQPSTLQIGGILGSWVRGQVYTRPDGVTVYGYIYDAGSSGGAGMNRFGEVILRKP